MGAGPRALPPGRLSVYRVGQYSKASRRWAMAMMGEALQARGWEIYQESLSLPLNFIVILKLP